MKFPFHFKIIIIIGIIAINNIATASSAPLKINAGIIPVGSLVSMLNSGTKNEVNVILSNPNMSPHESIINVKEMQAIKDSDVLILVSKNFEHEIAANINTTKTKVIYLDELISNVSPNDPHFWLDINIAKEILQVLAVELGKIDPNNAKAYRHNATKFSDKIAELGKDMQKNLASVQNNFMVYHDGWSYFIKANHLNAYYKGSITKESADHHDMDTILSAQDIIKLTAFVKKNNVVCIFIEPQFTDTTLLDFIAKNNLKTAVLNPIGEMKPSLVESYFLMMRNNAKQLKSCAS
ncbi:MAG: metal ABC transporter substrate-binding protein [Alphaproteobacteria bacterium]|jgi:zinc transport system substrate-binding protein|nr:metal ABC transporter substrate-binding protein [Alphaproteobacteria bacterium]